MNPQDYRVHALVAGGTLIGGVGGYFLANYRLKKRYQAIADEEIASVKEQYARLRKDGAYSTPESAVKTLAVEPVDSATLTAGKSLVQQILRDQGYSEPADEDASVTQTTTSEARDGTPMVVTNIFNVARDDSSIGNNGAPLENPERNSDAPYLIKVDEFMTDEEDFDKLTVTYYAEDDVLVDEREEIIPDVLMTVGGDAFNNFGWGTTEEHIVYIRNERLRADFEIVREEGSYARQVLGIEPSETKDDRANSRVRKTRDDD